MLLGKQPIIYFALPLAAALSTCKPPEHNENARTRHRPATEDLRSEVKFYASASDELFATSQEFYTIWRKEFITQLRDDVLPTNASVPAEKQPYSGFWYPERKGGTGIRLRGDSALEKYDKAFNSGKFLATDWEKQHHTRPESDPDASWAGHCNGFSASAQRHKEPFKDVQEGSIKFEPQDVKALLAEMNMGVKYYFLGGNRCDDDNAIKSPTTRSDPLKMTACEDMNPGTFHLALANIVGRLGHTLIMDTFGGRQVWNYPVFKYKSTITRGLSKADALTAIGAAAASTYKFNPSATKFASVTTVVTHADAYNDGEPLGNVAPTLKTKELTLTYILELNDNDQVIGGEWTGLSQTEQKKHPDFIWVALEPLPGDGVNANPHLDVAQVLKLWSKSIGADPENPPLDIVEPPWLEVWGKFQHFDVELDGSASGSAFLGKPLEVVVKRRDQLADEVKLDVQLDGVLIKSVEAPAQDAIQFNFDTTLGLHRLQFIFKDGDKVIEDQSLRFHAIP